jgi:hypothetical protein
VEGMDLGTSSFLTAIHYLVIMYGALDLRLSGILSVFRLWDADSVLSPA